jgi:hypothetical protein
VTNRINRRRRHKRHKARIKLRRVCRHWSRLKALEIQWIEQSDYPAIGDFMANLLVAFEGELIE